MISHHVFILRLYYNLLLCEYQDFFKKQYKYQKAMDCRTFYLRQHHSYTAFLI